MSGLYRNQPRFSSGVALRVPRRFLALARLPPEERLCARAHGSGSTRPRRSSTMHLVAPSIAVAVDPVERCVFKYYRLILHGPIHGRRSRTQRSDSEVYSAERSTQVGSEEATRTTNYKSSPKGYAGPIRIRLGVTPAHGFLACLVSASIASGHKQKHVQRDGYAHRDAAWRFSAALKPRRPTTEPMCQQRNLRARSHGAQLRPHAKI